MKNEVGVGGPPSAGRSAELCYGFPEGHSNTRTAA